MDKLKNFLNKSKNLRISVPNFLHNSLFSSFYEEDEPVKEENQQKEEKKKEKKIPSLFEKLNKKLLHYKEIETFYKKTGIQPIFIAIILIIMLIFIFIGIFDRLLTIIIGTAYPLYMSIKTVRKKIIEENENEEEEEEEENEGETENDIIHWLSYWVIFSVFINFENLFKFLLNYIPFYFFIKVLFLLFCYLPQFRFANYLYKKFIKKLFSKYEKTVIDYSNKLVKKLTLNIEPKIIKKSITMINDSSKLLRNKGHLKKIKKNNDYFEINETYDERKNKRILADMNNDDLNMTQDNLESNLNNKIKEKQKKNLKKVIKDKKINLNEGEKKKKNIKIVEKKEKKEKKEKNEKDNKKEEEKKEENENKGIDYYMNNNLDFM